MAKGIGSVHVRRQRGKMTVIAYGQTPRGQKFPKAEVIITADEKEKEKIKGEVATAVEKLLA